MESWMYLLYNLGDKNHDLVKYENILSSKQNVHILRNWKKEVYLSSHSTDMKLKTVRV